jgi:hypothetical protein
MRSIVAATMMFASVCVFGAGTTYKWVDEDGRVHYSDLPPPANAKKIEQKKVGGNVVETSELPYEVREAVKKYPVTLYASDCGEACDKARELLRTRGVPYTEKNPELEEVSKELEKASGALHVPALQVGETTMLRGLEQAQWNRELDAAGYPKTSLLRKPAPPPPVAPAVNRQLPPAGPATVQ